MVGLLEVATVAFVAQLAVLPGEKVQFIIAGLSTRYDPKVVVAAAGSAFAGWTAVEIAFGRALQAALPPLALDAVTAVLFFAFAVLLYRSAPARNSGFGDAERTDGGLAAFDDLSLPGSLDRYSESFGGFFPIFLLTAIWFGEMLAIIPVSLANAYLFSTFAGRFDMRLAHFGSALLFAFFGADTVLSMATGFSVWEAFVGAVGGFASGLF